MESNNDFTMEQLQSQLQRFGVYDYIVFAAMLVLSASIGLYYALWGKDDTKTKEEEFLMGGRNMSILPVSFSLIATFISGILLIGTPTELYVYGTQYAFIFIGVFLMGFVAGYVFLPVLHELQLSSTYEYLERRFDSKLRTFGSVIFTITLINWLPLVIYVPALAFNQVTGISVHIVTPCVCLVCIFYTCVGGLKAVVWADSIQTCMMVLCLLVIIIKGTIDIGGFDVVWQRSYDSGRIELPSAELNMELRHSLWSVTIASFIIWLQASVCNQTAVQRFMSLPTTSHAQKALFVFIIGVFLMSAICMYAGLLTYAYYHDCDPLTTKLAKAKDQVFPLLVMQVLGDYPGMPGLFVAGVFSAALSSFSSGLSAMSAIVLEDFVKPFSKGISQTKANIIMKSVVVVLGTTCVGLVFIVEKLGTVLQLSTSLGGVTNGAMLGIFTCGMLIPWTNSKGCLIGGISGVLVTGILVYGAQGAIATGSLTFQTKTTSTAGCGYLFNNTTANDIFIQEPSYVFPLYRISYLWFTPIGTVITILVSVIASYATGFTNLNDIDPAYVSPVIRRFLPKRLPSIKEEIETMLPYTKQTKTVQLKTGI